MILTLLAALRGPAQERFVVYEGARSSHFVAEHPGSSYSWQILVDFTSDTKVAPGDYEFVSATDKSEVAVQWHKSGWYYLAVTETDPAGCTNTKVLPVNVVTNSRIIGFAEVASQACFDSAGNGFTLLLNILENNNAPPEEDIFPVDIGFTVNGSEYHQPVNFESQRLEITADMFGVDPVSGSEIRVEIQTVTDRTGAPIAVQTDAGVHLRRIFAMPVIAFDPVDLPIETGTQVRHQLTMTAGEPQNAVYSWNINQPGGSSTNPENFNGNFADILWDGSPGNYSLSVMVVDGNGCFSETVVNEIEVIKKVVIPVAVDDYDTTNYRTGVKIPVLANDTDEENSIDPASLTITLPPFNGTAYVDFNDYTVYYKPADNFSGTDNFEYQVCNASGKCDKAGVYVLVNEFILLIPDAFSPNGDGINDYFEIVGIENYPNNSLTIINRWGNKVFEAKRYGIESVPKFWDGRSNTGFTVGKQELPTGTYYYIFDPGNGEKSISGSVYLDR